MDVASLVGQPGMVQVGEKGLPRSWFNPAWLERERHWRLFEVVYQGGEKFIRSKDPLTLFSHERESSRSYLDRQRRAYYRNHAEAIISLKADAIFQPRVSRAQANDPTFEDFLKDVDRRGTNADPFWSDVGRWVMALGEYWVGIAMPAAPDLAAKAAAKGELVSEKAARDAKLRPFYYTLSPRSVIDWVEDEEGNLEYVMVVEIEQKRQPFLKREEAEKPRLVIRVITRTDEQRYAVGLNGARAFLGSTPHPFGRVPLARVRIRKDGRSQLEDIAPMSVAVFNLDSMVMEQATRQTFNQLVFKVEKPEDAMAVISGTDTVIPLKVGEDAVFLAPNPATLSTLREYAWEIVDEIWATAHLRSRPGGKGQQPATDTSGVAYAYEWKAAEADLFGIAVQLEEAEIALGEMRAAALKLKPGGFKASYPREFDIRALMSRANEVQTLLKVDLGPTAAARMRQGLARKALPQTPADDLAKMDAEIEKLSEREAKQREAAPTAPGGTPPPPNQGMQPPGEGAGEDRTERAAKPEEKP